MGGRAGRSDLLGPADGAAYQLYLRYRPKDGYPAWVGDFCYSFRMAACGLAPLGKGSSGGHPTEIWTNYTIEEGLPSDYISSLAVSTDGTLWIGTSKYRPDRDGKKDTVHFGWLDERGVGTCRCWRRL